MKRIIGGAGKTISTGIAVVSVGAAGVGAGTAAAGAEWLNGVGAEKTASAAVEGIAICAARTFLGA